jgi:hypothetical protein
MEKTIISDSKIKNKMPFIWKMPNPYLRAIKPAEKKTNSSDGNETAELNGR